MVHVGYPAGQGFHFLAYFPYFEKAEYAYEITLLCVYVCLCILPIFARQRFGKYSRIIARQWLGKNPLIVARQQLGRNVTAVMKTHATIEELLDESFSMWPVSYQGK
jgi:hypothetical protein